MSRIANPTRLLVQTSMSGSMAARLDELAAHHDLAPSRFNGVLVEQVLGEPTLDLAWQALLDAEGAKVELTDRVTVSCSVIDVSYDALHDECATRGRAPAAVMRALLTVGIENVSTIPGMMDAMTEAWLLSRGRKATTARGAA